MFGQKQGGENLPGYLDDLEQGLDFGAEMSFAGKDWPVYIAVDVLGSASDAEFTAFTYDYYYGYTFTDAKAKANSEELAIGVRKIWGDDSDSRKGWPARPYIGAGPCLVRGEIKFNFSSPVLRDEGDNDTALGYWVGGGVLFRIGHSFNLGLNTRYSKADVSLGSDKFNVGGVHYGVMAGWAW